MSAATSRVRNFASPSRLQATYPAAHMEIDRRAPPPGQEGGAAVARQTALLRTAYIVDDDQMVRRALGFALKASGFDTLSFASGRDFLDRVDGLTSGCVLLDLRMPGMDGIAVIEALGDRVHRFPVAVISGHGDLEVAVKAMKRGASDFLEKPFTDAALMETLDLLSAALAARMSDLAERENALVRVAGLTPRERELLQGLAGGLSNKSVAEQLGISVRTVEMHRGNLMKRLGAGSVAEVVRLAILAGVTKL
ncbi:response regulator [Sphingomonas sp. S1-29]|uniref:response regulator transcription factor n=1 Tax=Sphingomonas sp. S1-29 TaxID=2991074 RepID=UPI00223FB513|nr:response regulator [Sphingomonas sp. S1-29]UZK69061.1 response regulator [Sphingomonas sp. S1-29]